MDETRHGPDGGDRPSTTHCPPAGPLDRQAAEGRLRRELERQKRCCANCVYATRPRGRWFRLILSHFAGLFICTNSPEARGQIRGVIPTGVCRYFHAKRPPVVRTAPPDPPDDKTCFVPLTQGYHAIVDAADFERVARHRWCVSRTVRHLYAQRRTHGRTIFMHQFIMHPPKGRVVDHINGNGLDNRRSNLRICTRQQNTWNLTRKKREGATSQYIGVHRYKKRPNRWYVKIKCGDEYLTLGPFDSEIEAARARDRQAIIFFGPYAHPNLPEEWPPERRAAVMAEAREQGRTPGAPVGKRRKRNDSDASPHG